MIAGSRKQREVGAALYGLVSSSVRRGGGELSLTAASTLATLDRTGPRRITDLAMTQGVSQPSMTVLVTSLQRSGLVERRTDPADRRVALIALTATGSTYVSNRRRRGAERFAELIGKLPEDEWTALLAAGPALRHLQQLSEELREQRA